MAILAVLLSCEKLLRRSVNGNTKLFENTAKIAVNKNANVYNVRACK